MIRKKHCTSGSSLLGFLRNSLHCSFIHKQLNNGRTHAI